MTAAIDVKHIRVDNVGSLAAPPRLMQVYDRFDAGQANADDLRAAQDEELLKQTQMLIRLMQANNIALEQLTSQQADGNP